MILGALVKNSYVGYGAFSKTDKGQSEARWIATASTIDGVKDSLTEFQDPSYEPHSADQAKVTIDVESAVGRGVWSFYSQLKSFYEVAAVSEVVPRAFVSSFFEHKIRQRAESKFDKVADFNGTAIYGLSDVDMIYVNKQSDRWNSISDGFDKLPGALLLSLVAGFDSAFADFVRVLLTSKPERYSGSDRQYSISEILKLNSLEQLIGKAVDDEIHQLMNKSHSDQISFFEKSFDISIQKHYERWGEFIEIFERRNLAAHGNLKVNERYLENCKRAKFPVNQSIGDSLAVNESYLNKSIDILIEFDVLLALAAWQKQYPNSVSESFGAVVEVSYSLIKEDHSIAASRILDYGLKVRSKGADDVSIKMMIINLAIAHKMNGETEKFSSVLKETDWSASAPNFRLCLAAIKEDVDAACDLLEAAKLSDNVSAAEVREWPAFRWIRKNEKFKEKCEKVFGEPLSPTSVLSANILPVEEKVPPADVKPRRRRRAPAKVVD